MRFARLSLFGAVFVGALSIGSVAEAQVAPPPPARSVSIMGRQFLPKKLIVPQGTTVTWKNLDPVRHTVGSPRIGDLQANPPAIPQDELNPRSGTLPCAEQGGTGVCDGYSMTFNTPGTFAFVCSIHRSMAGTIVVKEPVRTTPPDPAPPPPPPPPAGQVERRVSILGRQFSPRVMRIKQGESVKWANGSTTPHTITSVLAEDPAQPNRPDPIRAALGPTGLLAARAIPNPARPLTKDDYVVSPAVVFDVPGTYSYQCLIYPGMAGQINVAAVNPDA